jgi:CRISPR-associated protein Csb2
MLVIAWQYLSGRAVATDPTDRSAAEWPPHPDRVFQALVAAWGDTGCNATGERALEWLAALDAPQIACPLEISIPEAPRTYVPVNDIATSPAHRERKPRRFPSVLVGDAVCALVWPDTEPGEHFAALSELCSAVSHVGHSISVVRMTVERSSPVVTLKPASGRGDYSLRVPRAGRLTDLKRAFSGGGPNWTRPPTAPWRAYEILREDQSPRGGDFDPRLLVVRFVSQRTLSLTDGPAVVLALRSMLIAGANGLNAARRLISGHESDGAPLRVPHVSLLPLAFVGDMEARSGMHADGHLMGVGVALPRDVSPDEEQEILLGIAGALRKTPEGHPRLLLGSRGTVDLAFDVPAVPPRTLDPITWCRATQVWATVTPIALDHSAPRRNADHDGWATDQIRLACARQNLPDPQVELLPVSRFLGVPTSAEFPPLVRKDGTRRWHVHACLRFPHRVSGPLVLGAGRYRGYGLLRPMVDT